MKDPSHELQSVISIKLHSLYISYILNLFKKKQMSILRTRTCTGDGQRSLSQQNLPSDTRSSMSEYTIPKYNQPIAPAKAKLDLKVTA